MTEEKPKKKLIEVAIPLEAINDACVHEKSVPRRGHPATMHTWWARRPLAAARAVILTSLLEDPSNYLKPKEAEKERKRLFKLVEDVCKWENSNNKSLLQKVEFELKKNNSELPPLLDFFCGGGTIPLEGIRLGMNSYGIDLNPIAVLISKSLVEIVQEFDGIKPVNPSSTEGIAFRWDASQAFAEDISYYGYQINSKVKEKIEKYYPRGKNNELVIAWFWCKTIKCPNPACGHITDLVKNYQISTKKEGLYFEPVINEESIKYLIKNGNAKIKSSKEGRGANFRCLFCNSSLNEKYVKQQSIEKKIKYKLMGFVCRGSRQKRYYSADDEQEKKANDIQLKWIPEDRMEERTSTLVSGRGYGIKYWHELFTKRQLLALTTFSDTIKEFKEIIYEDAKKKLSAEDNRPLCDGGTGARAYSEAIVTYLSFAVDKLADWNSVNCSWIPRIEGVGHTFSKQAIPISWDFIEINPFSESVGNFLNHIKWISLTVKNLPLNAKGNIINGDSSSEVNFKNQKFLISTDPPYYDYISYADLSDFFYIWQRAILKEVWPNLFSTVLVPKAQELVAASYRFNNDVNQAKEHFQKGLEKSLKLMLKMCHKDFPVTIYYAFKQTEQEEVEGGEKYTSSTGWETMLDGLINAGFQIIRTWPMRTERSARSIGIGTNALTSSIILVCRPRKDFASLTTRREFSNALKKDLPPALKNLQDAGISPVDLAQSAIGPGMAVFSRYSKVMEADGSTMSVKTALQLINQELDTYLTEQESEMDKETRFCIAWFEQFGWGDGLFGDANTLANAKGTAVNALEKEGILHAKAGKVRLLKRIELSETWDPAQDKRLTIWECVQQMIKSLDIKGEGGAAEILEKIGGLSEPVKELAYRLYALCEKKGWTEDALAYNALISSWQSISDKTQFLEHIREETKKEAKDKAQTKLTEDE